MEDYLKIGDTLRTLAGIEIKVQKCMSEDGGQGRVYAVDYGGTQKVLKWYKKSFLVTLSQRIVRYDRNGRAKGFEDPDLADDVHKNALEAFYGNLCYNAKNKPEPVSLGNELVWPIDVVVDESDSTSLYFGYVMDFIYTADYNELNKFYNFTVRFASRNIMLTCCLNIAEAFRKLHSCGFCHQDLSGGNIYAHPQTGDIRIADNDNVATNGENYGIGGTEGYMAPEVLSGYTPDKYTDLFSLAVILFRIMMGGQHPFKGKYSQETDDNMIAFCKDPVFIFDDTDKRNAPVAIRHKNAMILWPQYPSYIQDLFKRAFKTKMVEKELDRINPKTGDKMHVFVDANRESRPTAEEWIEALTKLCGDDNFCKY